MNFCFGERRLISLPTGYGKSLCYALPLLVFDRLRDCWETSKVLCISPLTVGTSSKFSVHRLQSEFYQSASTRFKEHAVHITYASSRCLLVRSFRKLYIKQTLLRMRLYREGSGNHTKLCQEKSKIYCSSHRMLRLTTVFCVDARFQTLNIQDQKYTQEREIHHDQ